MSIGIKGSYFVPYVMEIFIFLDLAYLETLNGDRDLVFLVVRDQEV